MRVLLTGADGFLARACLIELRTRGHDVTTTDRQGTVDLAGDLADGCFCATLPRVDAVVHAAAVQYVSKDLPWVRRKEYFLRNNVEATRKLCLKYSGSTTHFVNIGTSMMYTQSGLATYHAGGPMSAQGIYSLSKLAAQSHVDALPNAKATIIPCIIGGIGREGLFRSFVTLMRTRGIVVFPGSGYHKISMVHVRDVASLVGSVLEGKRTGLFNAAGSNPLSIAQWIEEIANELQLDGVRTLRLPLTPVWALSALTGYRALAREQLLMLSQPHVLNTDESLATGWRPQYTNAQIVREIARHIATDA